MRNTFASSRFGRNSSTSISFHLLKLELNCAAQWRTVNWRVEREIRPGSLTRKSIRERCARDCSPPEPVFICCEFAISSSWDSRCRWSFRAGFWFTGKTFSSNTSCRRTRRSSPTSSRARRRHDDVAPVLARTKG